MHQLMFVGVLQAQRRLADDLACRADAQRAARRLGHADELLQIDAIDVLHRQEMDPAGLARVVGPHDVRMIQPADRLHLATEAADGLGIVQVAVGQDLQGHDLVEVDLPGLVDDAHAAVADFLQQFVVAQAAGLDDPAEDAFDQFGAFGKSAAIIFHLQEVPERWRKSSSISSNSPSSRSRSLGRGLEQDLFDQGRACPPGRPSRTGRRPGRCGRSTRSAVASVLGFPAGSRQAFWRVGEFSQ